MPQVGPSTCSILPTDAVVAFVSHHKFAKWDLQKVFSLD